MAFASSVFDNKNNSSIQENKQNCSLFANSICHLGCVCRVFEPVYLDTELSRVIIFGDNKKAEILCYDKT